MIERKSVHACLWLLTAMVGVGFQGVIMHSCDAENGWSPRACDAPTYVTSSSTHVMSSSGPLIIFSFLSFLFFCPSLLCSFASSPSFPSSSRVFFSPNCFRFLSRVEFFSFLFSFFFLPQVCFETRLSRGGRAWFNGYGEFVREGGSWIGGLDGTWRDLTGRGCLECVWFLRGWEESLLIVSLSNLWLINLIILALSLLSI